MHGMMAMCMHVNISAKTVIRYELIGRKIGKECKRVCAVGPFCMGSCDLAWLALVVPNVRFLSVLCLNLLIVYAHFAAHIERSFDAAIGGRSNSII